MHALSAQTGPRLRRFGAARWLAHAAVGVLALVATSALAKIDLVTLPERASTQLTIYNSQDLTLVRESRVLTFAKGTNQIQFSWANTLIDPTSLQLFFKENPGNFTISEITYPANTENVLIWNVQANEPATAEIEILYFSSGLSWAADYVGRANASETEMSVENYVRVTNQSGEDFEKAQVRVIVGTVNLEEKIADLARRRGLSDRDRSQMQKAAGRMVMSRAAKREMALGMAAAPASAAMDAVAEMKEIVKEAVGEFQIYTIEGTETIKNGWSRRLRAFSKEGVKIEVAYEYDERKYGSSITRLYRSKNNSENKLGDSPLPEGVWRVYRDADGGGLAWVGSFSNKYVPVGEKIELNLGNDGLLTLEPKLLSRSRSNFDYTREDRNVGGYNETEDWRIEARNAAARPVALKVVQYFDGDWTLTPKGEAKNMKPTKRDESAFVFEATVGAQTGIAMEYDLLYRKGTNSKKR